MFKSSIFSPKENGSKNKSKILYPQKSDGPDNFKTPVTSNLGHKSCDGQNKTSFSASYELIENQQSLTKENQPEQKMRRSYDSNRNAFKQSPNAPPQAYLPSPKEPSEYGDDEMDMEEDEDYNIGNHKNDDCYIQAIEQIKKQQNTVTEIQQLKQKEGSAQFINQKFISDALKSFGEEENIDKIANQSFS